MSKWEKAGIGLILTLIIGFSVYELYSFRSYVIDDAYITYRYAENILSGEGIVYNKGEKVEGFSSPLHLMILVLCGSMGISLPLAAKILGTLSYAGILLILGKMILSLTRKTMTRFTLFTLLAALIASSYQLTFFAITGMETVIFAFLVTLLFSKMHKNPRIDAGAAILFFLIFLGRAEGFLIPLFTVLYLVIIRYGQKETGKRILSLFKQSEYRYLGIFIFAAAVFLLMRYFYFHDFLPNTFYAKLPWASGSRVHWLLKGFDDIILFFSLYGGPFLLLPFFSGLSKHNKERNTVILALLFFAAYLFFQKWVGGDWMLGARFMAPAAPAVTGGVLLGVHYLLTANRNSEGNKKLSWGIIILSLFIAGNNLVKTVELNKSAGGYPVNVMTSEGLPELGRWLKEHIPENYLMRAYRIGAVGYYSDLRIVDDHGLINKEVARLRGAGTFEAQNDTTLSYIRSLNPEVLLLHCDENKPPEPGYVLIHKGYNAKQCLGVWLREELAAEFMNQ